MTAVIILALIALFVGLRLFSVLGERTGHEQQPLVKAPDGDPSSAQPVPQTPAGDTGTAEDPASTNYVPLAGPGVRALLAADPDFDVARFLNGAEAAYRMILEAFWAGDLSEVEQFVDDNVLEAFATAITARKEEGLSLDNRLVALEQSTIVAAKVDQAIAELTVRFEADIAAVTRNAEGEAVAGSMADAVQTRDRWTFRHDIASQDPNWILVETDEDA